MEEMEEKSSKPEISIRWQYRRTLNHDFSFRKKERKKKKKKETTSTLKNKKKKREIINNKNYMRKDLPILSSAFLALNNF